MPLCTQKESLCKKTHKIIIFNQFFFKRLEILALAEEKAVLYLQIKQLLCLLPQCWFGQCRTDYPFLRCLPPDLTSRIQHWFCTCGILSLVLNVCRAKLGSQFEVQFIPTTTKWIGSNVSAVDNIKRTAKAASAVTEYGHTVQFNLSEGDHERVTAQQESESWRGRANKCGPTLPRRRIKAIANMAVQDREGSNKFKWVYRCRFYPASSALSGIVGNVLTGTLDVRRYGRMTQRKRNLEPWHN